MIVLIWIDWYPYHHARLRALVNHKRIGDRAAGIELVGRSGVHRGLVFREADDSLPVTTLMPNSNWSVPVQIRGAGLLWKELSRLNPEVVFVPGYYNVPALAAALWALVKRRRTVLMTESTQHDLPRTAWKERLKSLLIGTLFDYAIAGGKAHVRYLRALGFPAERIAECYDVVDNAFYASRARVLRAQQKDTAAAQPFFLFTGRLAPEKNVAGLIDAFAAYRCRGGSWKLTLAGGGPDEPALRTQAAKSGYGGDICFAGLKTSGELTAYYAAAGCFILPSLREPWGLVVNEALASALPVIVSDRCGCVEDLVVNGLNGYLFDPARSDELALCMQRMESAGDGGRRRMGEESEKLVSRVSPERWADEVARIGLGAGESDAVLLKAAVTR